MDGARANKLALRGWSSSAWALNKWKANLLGSLLFATILVISATILVYVVDGVVSNKTTIATLLFADVLVITFFAKGVYPHMYIPSSDITHRFTGRFVLDKKT